MSDLSLRIAALSPEQRALLTLKLERTGLARKEQPPVPPRSAPLPSVTGQASRHLDFSLFYFSSDETQSPSGAPKYQLLLDGARFADQRGFKAVWTPERHFHPFGGLYPNPSVLSAALAMITQRVELRAGSVVLPLHHPVRIAEEWSVVDNLSNGRVGLAFASGWHANDFVFAPERYADRKDSVNAGVDALRRLWRGEALPFVGGGGAKTLVKTFPRPVQPELPIWMTAARSIDTFVKAGERGTHVLTALLDLTVDQLAERVAAYREARARHGHAPELGVVTVMAHTFLGTDSREVEQTVRGPLHAYLRSHGELAKSLAQTGTGDLTLTRADEDALLDFAFQRYLNGQSLIGTPQTCLAMADRLRGAGVNEVACLIDFGVAPAEVLASLEHLAALKDQVAANEENVHATH